MNGRKLNDTLCDPIILYFGKIYIVSIVSVINRIFMSRLSHLIASRTDVIILTLRLILRCFRFPYNQCFFFLSCSYSWTYILNTLRFFWMKHLFIKMKEFIHTFRNNENETHVYGLCVFKYISRHNRTYNYGGVYIAFHFHFVNLLVITID